MSGTSALEPPAARALRGDQPVRAAGRWLGRRRLVFVGERRSERARQIGASWERGGLCANTLHGALRACGIDPSSVVFCNLFQEGTGVLHIDQVALAQVRALAADGATIVALGRGVQRALGREGVGFLALVHPAARGRIRARARYRAHVADVLASAR
jgi:hypothetical protein